MDLIGSINKSLADLDGTMGSLINRLSPVLVDNVKGKSECDSESKVSETSPATRELRIIRDRIDNMTDRLKEVIDIATLISQLE